MNFERTPALESTEKIMQSIKNKLPEISTMHYNWTFSSVLEGLTTDLQGRDEVIKTQAGRIEKGRKLYEVVKYNTDNPTLSSLGNVRDALSIYEQSHPVETKPVSETTKEE